MWPVANINVTAVNHPDSPAPSCTQVDAFAPRIKLRRVKRKAVCNIGDLHLKAQRQASRHIRAKQYPYGLARGTRGLPGVNITSLIKKGFCCTGKVLAGLLLDSSFPLPIIEFIHQRCGFLLVGEVVPGQ